MEQTNQIIKIIFDTRNIIVSITLAAVTTIILFIVFYRKREKRREEDMTEMKRKKEKPDLFQVIPEPLAYPQAMELMTMLRIMGIEYKLVCPKGYDNDPKKEDKP